MIRRLVPLLAASALACPAAADAVTMSVGVGPNSGFATQVCTGPGPSSASSDSHAVSVSQTCIDNFATVGVASASAFSSFGHIGVAVSAASVTPSSLAAGDGATATFVDFLRFTSDDPAATTADVSVNLDVLGQLNAANGFGGAQSSIRGFLILGGAMFEFDELAVGDGSHTERNDFSSSGPVFLPTVNDVFTSPVVTVALNSPVMFRIQLEGQSGAAGEFASASLDFAHSFSLAHNGPAFNLADGVTVNAGDYLVDNRFIDPLAPASGAPEPAAWALMIAGLGLAGACLRRRRVQVA